RGRTILHERPPCCLRAHRSVASVREAPWASNLGRSPKPDHHRATRQSQARAYRRTEGDCRRFISRDASTSSGRVASIWEPVSKVPEGRKKIAHGASRGPDSANTNAQPRRGVRAKRLDVSRQSGSFAPPGLW